MPTHLVAVGVAAIAVGVQTDVTVRDVAARILVTIRKHSSCYGLIFKVVLPLALSLRNRSRFSRPIIILIKFEGAQESAIRQDLN